MTWKALIMNMGEKGLPLTQQLSVVSKGVG